MDTTSISIENLLQVFSVAFAAVAAIAAWQSVKITREINLRKHREGRPLFRMVKKDSGVREVAGEGGYLLTIALENIGRRAATNLRWRVEMFKRDRNDRFDPIHLDQNHPYLNPVEGGTTILKKRELDDGIEYPPIVLYYELKYEDETLGETFTQNRYLTWTGNTGLEPEQTFGEPSASDEILAARRLAKEYQPPDDDLY